MPAPKATPKPPVSLGPKPTGRVCQWCYTGIPAHRMAFRSGPYPFGRCTFYAWLRDTRLTGLHNAGTWDNFARGRGFRVGSTPAPNSTVVFEANVQGAGHLGHVGHVERVLGNGWFLLSEMNFTWNGGGNSIVSYRFAHAGPGVSFIYR